MTDNDRGNPPAAGAPATPPQPPAPPRATSGSAKPLPNPPPAPSAAPQPPTTPPQPPASLPPVPTPRHSLSLGKRLERQERHPVLIFGSASSGKSSFILSIISALGDAEEVNVNFSDNEPILDEAEGDAQLQAHAAARQFYDWGLYRWSAGEPPPPNSGERVFIPIEVQPRYGDKPAVKFAILDGRGEDYAPLLASGNQALAPIGELRRPLGDEIKKLLKEYSHEITVIYVAPCSQADTLDAAAGLRHAIQEYSSSRSLDLREKDSHLFLLTKWDENVDPLVKRAGFEEPSPLDVLRRIRPRYEGAWGQFCGLALGDTVRDRRVFMQYAAGYFSEGKLAPPPDLIAKTIRRYPRTVANWLYSRAAYSTLVQRSTEPGDDLDIFLDVRLERNSRSWADNMIRLILSDVAV
ncbi:MAG: hypothetical protein WC804_21545 [Sphingomonas sp.]|jgi:hypothetical protein|uniref:hypothetical protein n=1 Tax=Sphingomonas sp. TaxID=28214 RepID=UPI003566C3A4